MKNKTRKNIAVAGALVSFLIGSGFATGQELMQFYVSYGLLGCVGSLLLSGILLSWVSVVAMEDGNKLQLDTANAIWKYYCGRIPGKVIEIFTIVFLFLILVVMISGAGAAVNQCFGLEPVVGRAIMAFLVLLTVFLGISRLTKVLSAIGVALIALVLAVAVVALVQNAGQIGHADARLAGKEVVKASPRWWLSGPLYASFVAVCFVPFLIGVSKELSTPRDARRSGMLGMGVFYLVSALVCFALLSTIEHTAEASIPTQIMADQIGSAFSFLYFALLFLGIFSTAIALLWLCCNAVFKDEKSLRFRLLGAAACFGAFFASVLPYKTVLNVVFSYTGYLGFFVVACMLYKRYFHGKIGKRRRTE